LPDGPSAHSHAGKEVPNARSMVSAFGPDSPAFHQAYPELLALFQHVKDVPEVSLQFRLWRGYQLGVDRSPEDDEALFIRETYVALLARLVARMFLDVSPITKDVTELTKILEGEFFQAQNITNFIEDDFFTWLLCPPVVDQGAALMATLGIGLKVNTLPVVALGVGIGVDYGIYIYSRLHACLKQGMTLYDAYFHALKQTGKPVIFTAFTLAIGVGTWIFSTLQFQADMGKLLAFMFFLNMVGAVLLLPALARIFLLKPRT